MEGYQQLTQTLIDSFPSRKPILDKDSEFEMGNEIDRQWELVTERVRRDLLNNNQLRKVLLFFISIPLSERIPQQFLEAVSQYYGSASRLLQRYQQSLGLFAGLPAVPDEVINPDITYAPKFISPERRLQRMFDVYGRNPEDLPEALNKLRKSDVFLTGLSAAERELIARRYRFARDVKLLAFMAESVTHRDELQQIQTSVDVQFPSGIVIHGNPVLFARYPELSNPQAWKKRKMKKDRVFELTVDEKRFILKERKTARHVDTQKGGHREGNTSRQEFEIATLLRERALVEQDRAMLVWETPICSVDFPDGYSFVVFEYMEGLESMYDVQVSLEQSILQNFQQFRNEYENLNRILPTYARSEQGKIFLNDVARLSGIKDFLQLIFRWKKEGSLTYKDFSRVKARFLINLAHELSMRVFRDNNLENLDHDGWAYRVVCTPEVRLQLVGMDFEYIGSVTPEYAQESYETMIALDRPAILNEFKRDLKSSLQSRLASLWMYEQAGMTTINTEVLKKYGLR